MTGTADTADTAADVRHVVELLGAIDDPAATRVGHALHMWLRGTELEDSLGLVPGWRAHVRLTARDRALAGLVKMQTHMNISTLATWIVKDLERLAASTHAIRPDGTDGYLWDLVAVECSLGWRQWRRLIAQLRSSAG
jgi:hypothetical protein